MYKSLFYFCFYLSLAFLSFSSHSTENYAHCFKDSSASSCPPIQADPNKVIGDLAAQGELVTPALLDWYTDIELFESYIRVAGDFKNISRIWASAILGAVEYNYAGSFFHNEACSLVQMNPVEAYSYVYSSRC